MITRHIKDFVMGNLPEDMSRERLLNFMRERLKENPEEVISMCKNATHYNVMSVCMELKLSTSFTDKGDPPTRPTPRSI